MQTAIDTVLALMSACNGQDTEAALGYFSTDAIYHNIPIAPARGHSEIRAMLGGFLNQAKSVEFTVHHIAATQAGVVMTERTDRFELDSGWLELPVMGVFEVTNGKISAWRDYFDMAPLAPLLGAG